MSNHIHLFYVNVINIPCPNPEAGLLNLCYKRGPCQLCCNSLGGSSVLLNITVWNFLPFPGKLPIGLTSDFVDAFTRRPRTTPLSGSTHDLHCLSLAQISCVRNPWGHFSTIYQDIILTNLIVDIRLFHAFLLSTFRFPLLVKCSWILYDLSIYWNL